MKPLHRWITKFPNLSTALVLTLMMAWTAGAHAQIVWSDEFDSGAAPDPSIWTNDLGATGWGNQELQQYTDNLSNARIEDGNLVITGQLKTNQSGTIGFTSARLKTEHKLEFRYGTIEARIKVPDLENGLWPAFWTLGGDFSEVGWPNCGEIDIMEMGWQGAINDGLANRFVTSAAHWENNNQNADFGRNYSPALAEPEDLNDDFHIFSMDWTPNFITTFLDGKELWKMDISSGSCTDCTEFHQPHFILLNLAVGGTFTGLLSRTQITAPFPAEMYVDYVRIIDNGFTELSGSGLQTGPVDIGPAHSGSWYNDDQSGHGFSIEFGELLDGTPLAVIYWYIYDDQGNPIFMLGTGNPDGNRVEVNFQSPVGMVYGDFDRDTVVREDGGVGIFEFSDRDNATFTYQPSDFTAANWGHVTPVEDLPLVKLFGIPAPENFGGNASPN